jgi:hypothetical protein
MADPKVTRNKAPRRPKQVQTTGVVITTHTQAMRLSKAAEESARALGVLPHEFLHRIAAGLGIPQKRVTSVPDGRGGYRDEVVEETAWPSLPMRIDAAKAAAPYYAPRLTSQQVDIKATLDPTNLSDEELRRQLNEALAKLPQEHAADVAANVKAVQDAKEREAVAPGTSRRLPPRLKKDRK